MAWPLIRITYREQEEAETASQEGGRYGNYQAFDHGEFAAWI
jgi:hypothetical protein